MTADVYRTTEAVVIDGEIDPIWEQVEAHTCEYFDSVGDLFEPPEDYDFATDFKLLWDDENIYLLVMITDDNAIDTYDAAVNEWMMDAVEVYIDPANAKTNDMDNHIQYRFMYMTQDEGGVFPTNLEAWSEGSFSVTDGINSWYKLDTDVGWDLEVAFSIEAFNTAGSVDLGADSEMGFNMVPTDNDEGIEDERSNTLRWVETTGESWNHGDLMGNITLKYEDPPVGIRKGYVGSKKIRISPNPVVDEIHLSDISNVQRIEIINLVGQEIMTIRNPENKIINVSHLKAGVYMISLYSNDALIQTSKLSKE